MTLWGHGALSSPCPAADCLHFANQSVTMTTPPRSPLRCFLFCHVVSTV